MDLVTRPYGGWETVVAPIRVGVGEAVFCRRNAPEVLERSFGQIRDGLESRKCAWHAEGGDAAELLVRAPLVFECPSCGLAHGVVKDERGLSYGPLL